MTSSILGKCRFCGANRQLQNSHVIAEFCYKPTYDLSRAHRPATKLTGDPNHHSTVQKGYREHLFCWDCEQRFSTRLETPFARFWNRRVLDNVEYDLHRLEGFDYTVFKLFHWLNLWRASVATIPEFKNVALGPYEDKLRQRLWDHDAGPVEHYPLAGVVLLDDSGKVFNGLVTEPTRHKLNCSSLYKICYLGVEWHFFLTEHPHGELLQIIPGSPQLTGTMLLPAQNFKQSTSIQSLVRKRENFGKVRG